jgi:AcrR family transcriptional regulator
MSETNELKKRNALRLSNEESNQLTRDCIRTALRILIREKEYKKITVTDIIRKSGISRAGFYRNYTSKEDVLNDDLQILYQLVKEFMKEIGSDSPVRQKEYQYDWLKDPAVMKKIFCFIQDHAESFKMLINADIRDVVSGFNPPEESKESTSAESLTPLEKYKELTVNTAFGSILTRWLSDHMPETPEEMAVICTQIFENF